MRWWTLAKLYLVMEYAGGGELFTKITNEGRLKEPDAAPLFAQAMSAMDHLVSHYDHLRIQNKSKNLKIKKIQKSKNKKNKKKNKKFFFFNFKILKSNFFFNF